MLISIAVTLEIFLLILAYYLIVRKYTHSISQAFSFASILSLAFLSVSIQILFLTGFSVHSYVIDISVLFFSIYFVYKNYKLLISDFQRVTLILKNYKIFLFLLFPIFLYLFLQTFLMPPSNTDSMVYNLARVLIFRQEGTIYPYNVSIFHQVSFPLGNDILSFLFLRINSDYGLGVFSFLSYSTIILATFSLVRSYFQRNIAFLVSIVIASLYELILQSTSTKNDIPCTAAAIVILLAGRYFLLQKKGIHLYVLISVMLWGLSIKGYFAGFLVPFLFFFSILLFRSNPFKNPTRHLKFRDFRFHFAYLLPLGLFLCLILFYGNNWSRFGNLMGEKKMVREHIQKDGVKGMAVNMSRYIAQMAEIPSTYGYKLNQWHDALLKENRTIGTRGPDEHIDLAAMDFFSEDYTWFGPFGFFLILPSMLVALFLGRDYVRFTAAVLLSHFLILSYQIAWMEWNNRFFSLFFASSGLCMGFVFHHVLNNRKIKNGIKTFIKLVILIIAIYGMIAVTFQNETKSTVPVYHSRNLFYNLYRWGSDWLSSSKSNVEGFKWFKSVIYRDERYQKFYPHHMYHIFTHSIERGKRVLICGYFAPVFPLLFSRPDLHITVAAPGRVYINNTRYNMNIPGDFGIIREHFDYFVLVSKDLERFAFYLSLRNEEPLFYSEKGAIFRFKKQLNKRNLSFSLSFFGKEK